MAIHEIARRFGSSLSSQRKTRCDETSVRIASERVILAVPQVFMNESGGPVASLLSYYKGTADRLIVLHDELDIDFAALRTKLGGGDNGHNGLRSIRRSIGSGEFLRIRLGIGRPPGRQDPADFVLSPFSATERRELPFLLDRTADCVESLVTVGLERTQSTFNADPPRE
jgi:PTH1 family peptidyl-tRNA hydrolase